MFSAFAIADLSNFSTISDAAFGVNLTIANASSTSFPLIKSATILTFLLEILAYFRVALAHGIHCPALALAHGIPCPALALGPSSNA